MKAGYSQIEGHYRRPIKKGVVIPTSAALNRQLLCDLKPGKQEQCLSVNLYPSWHGPAH